jgi:hypothetical protein
VTWRFWQWHLNFGERALEKAVRNGDLDPRDAINMMIACRMGRAYTPMYTQWVTDALAEEESA